jgi:hypothetical protein
MMRLPLLGVKPLENCCKESLAEQGNIFTGTSQVSMHGLHPRYTPCRIFQAVTIRE